MIIGEVPGGTASLAHKVCNFPSQEDISGIDLMMKMRNQALTYGPKEFMDRVVDVKKMEDGTFVVKGQNYGEFYAKFVLIAIGTKRRKLGIVSEDSFVGKGVSYCATCDAMFYKNKVVAVIGGSNAATMSAVYLADVAEKVYIFTERIS
jgi:thioredoxin reductase (NADPH)